MAYTSIVICGRSYGAGLDWRPVASRKDLRSEAKSRGRYSGAVVRTNIGTPMSVGFLANGDKQIFARHPSAAAILARNIHNDERWGSKKLLLVEKAELGREELYWLVAVSDGQVYPGTDVVGDAEVIRKTIEESGFSPDSFVLGGSAIKEFFPNSKIMQGIDFETLCPWDRSQLRTSKVVSIPTSAIPLRPVLLVLFGLLGIYTFYDLVDGDGDKPIIDLAKLQAERSARSERSLNEALRRDGAFPNKAQFIDAMNPIYRSLPYYHKGWMLSALTCNAVEEICAAEFGNTSRHARPEALRSLVAEKGELSFINGGQGAVLAIPFHPERLESKLPENEANGSYEGYINALNPLLSETFSYSITSPTNVAIRDVTINDGRPYSMANVSWTLTGYDWANFVKNMKTPQTLVRRIDVRLSNTEIRTLVEGHYVAKPI